MSRPQSTSPSLPSSSSSSSFPIRSWRTLLVGGLLLLTVVCSSSTTATAEPLLQSNHPWKKITSSSTSRALFRRTTMTPQNHLKNLGSSIYDSTEGMKINYLGWNMVLPPSSSLFSSFTCSSSSSSSSSCLFTLRGGYEDDEDEEEEEYDSEEEEEEEDFEFDDDDDFDEMAMGNDDDDDFAEETIVERMIQSYHKTPPLTKGYLTASFIATSIGYFFHKNEFPSYFLLEWKPIYTKLQLWRPLTCFLNFGSFGIGYPLTVHFVWTYMSTLERLHHRKPYDFWIMIVFGMLSMLIGYPILKVEPRFLGHNLSTFLVYVWSRYHEGVEVGMFDLFTTRAELLPWFFLAQTFLLEGELPTLDFLGIVFGHIYHHCKTVGILRAPENLVNWYETSKTAETIRGKYKQISSDFEMI